MFFKDQRTPRSSPLNTLPAPRLILASTSSYRRDLLARLRVPFDSVAPEVEEQARPAELVPAMTLRLARAKAEAVAARYPGCVVIGSDQAASRDDDILGKPGTAEACREQLRLSAGREVVFLTAVHVIDGRDGGRAESHLDRTVVRFRSLAADEIARYVAADQPLDCAGGFKVESLGIALFERVESVDPTALTGLPLIWLCGALRRASIPVP